jgi:hypothetical protein
LLLSIKRGNRSLLLLLLLAGCGGGGSSSPGSGTPATTTLSGVVVAGSAYSAGNVYAYDYSAGTKGALLTSSVLSSNGTYSLSLVNAPSVVLIEATGCYTEILYWFNQSIPERPGAGSGDGSTVCTATPLAAVVATPPAGGAMVAAITPYTHAGLGLVEYKVRSGATAALAIADTGTALIQLLGFNPGTTLPAMPQHVETASDATVYGGLVAGIASWLYNVAYFSQNVTYSPVGSGALTTANFAAAMRGDFAQDGVLNGVGRNSLGNAYAISIANAALSTDTYRHQLAKYAVIRLRGDFENVVGATIDDLARIVGFLPALTAYNNNTSALFDSPPVVALDEGGPQITIFSPLHGSVISGAQGGINGYVLDITGIQPGDSLFIIDSAPGSTFNDPYQVTETFNAGAYPNGPHTLSVRSTNNFGTVNTRSVTVTFSH